MKRYKTILISILAILISGCGSSQMTQIDFHNFTLNIESSKIYILKQLDSSGYKGLIVYEEKKEDTEDLFQNSIIISYKDNINIKIKDFANQNIEHLKASIGSIKLQSTKTLGFNCSGNKITGIIKDFTIIDKEEETYYSQFFFIDNNIGYIISFNGDNQDDNSDFRQSLSNLRCTK